MNIYLFELKSLRKSILIWALSLSAVCAVFMSIYPAFLDSMNDVKKLLSGFPPEILKASGVNMDILFQIPGFYSMVFLYILLCGGICAVNLGLGTVSRENRSKTSDFLLSKPVSRTHVLSAKLIAILSALVLINSFYFAVSSITVLWVSPQKPDMKVISLISLTLLLTQLVFATIGVLMGVLFQRVKSVLTLSLSVTFGFFALSVLDDLIGKDAIRYLTPFKYFNTLNIMNNRAYDGADIAMVFIITLVGVSLSYYFYIRQDVKTV